MIEITTVKIHCTLEVGGSVKQGEEEIVSVETIEDQSPEGIKKALAEISEANALSETILNNRLNKEGEGYLKIRKLTGEPDSDLIIPEDE